MSDQLHEHLLITPPGETEPAPIDEGMVIVVGLLWQLGFKTTSCCQNIGGYMLHLSEVEDGRGNSRMASHYRTEAMNAGGLVSLSMPLDDAVIFLNLMAHLGDDEFAARVQEATYPAAWKKFVPLIPHSPANGFAQKSAGDFQLDTTAQLRFGLGDTQEVENLLLKARRLSFTRDHPLKVG